MKEHTLVLIKPDAVKRNLIGEIIQRYESLGVRIVGLKILNVDEDIVKRHYPDTLAESIAGKFEKAGGDVKDPKAYGKEVLSWLRKFIMSHMIVAIVFEGEDAARKVRKTTGYTDPSVAEKGTIRGDLGNDSVYKANVEHRPVYNLVHASGDAKEAKQEIKIWFKQDELYSN